MQTAVPAGTAVFRGKWKRTDGRFAAFGGRGELRSPLSPHRNVFSKHSGVPHGLFYDQAILWLDLQNAHAPGSLRSPSDAAPECFFKTFRCSARLIRQAETLELQPLRGLRWAGGASLPPAPPSPAALRIRDGQLQRLPLRGAGAQRLKGGCAMAMRSSAG